MTKEEKRDYMKIYWLEHKEEAKANRKRWYERNKKKQFEANKKVYQKLKESGSTWQQRNKERVNKYNREYKAKIVEELRQQGIKNPWAVYGKKAKPKYENN